MASASIEQELECSICLCIYSDPVILRCGHNFCRACIDCVLNAQEASGAYFCPECRHGFEDRPALQRSITLRNIVENLLSAHPDQDETGVLCTYCIHTPVPAIRSCLLCEASLCDNHLRVHSKSPDHVLCYPTTSLKNKKCCIHREPLKYYCTKDSTCICVSCSLIGEHKGHHMESLDEAAGKKKKKLRNDFQKLITIRKEMEERIKSLQELRSKAKEKAHDESKRINALFRDLGRRLEDLEMSILNDISGQAEQVLLSINDVTQLLQIKKDEVSRKMHDIDELCNKTDPLTVLQESDTSDMYDTDNGENKDRERHLHKGAEMDVAVISQTLHAGLLNIITEVKVYFSMDKPANLLLNANTACNKLQISDDGKTACCLPTQNRPETPETFKVYPQVISSQSFYSGQHFWEVDVGGSEWWRVGVCYPSIDRTGVLSWIGYNEKSWGLFRFHDEYWAIHDSKEIQLHADISSGRLRICLDYEAGRISFWAVCDRVRHLHTFTTTFTEPIHAAFGVWKGCIKI